MASASHQVVSQMKTSAWRGGAKTGARENKRSSSPGMLGLGRASVARTYKPPRNRGRCSGDRDSVGFLGEWFKNSASQL